MSTDTSFIDLFEAGVWAQCKCDGKILHRVSRPGELEFSKCDVCDMTYDQSLAMWQQAQKDLGDKISKVASAAKASGGTPALKDSDVSFAKTGTVKLFNKHVLYMYDTYRPKFEAQKAIIGETLLEICDNYGKKQHVNHGRY